MLTENQDKEDIIFITSSEYMSRQVSGGCSIMKRVLKVISTSALK